LANDDLLFYYVHMSRSFSVFPVLQFTSQEIPILV